MPSDVDLAKLRALAESHLTEHWHGTDTVMLAEGVLALLDEIERLESLWKSDPTAAAFRARDEAIDVGRRALAQLAAMTAARNEACEIAAAWISGGHDTATAHRNRIAALRAVGASK